MAFYRCGGGSSDIIAKYDFTKSITEDVTGCIPCYPYNSSSTVSRRTPVPSMDSVKGLMFTDDGRSNGSQKFVMYHSNLKNFMVEIDMGDISTIQSVTYLFNFNSGTDYGGFGRKGELGFKYGSSESNWLFDTSERDTSSYSILANKTIQITFDNTSYFQIASNDEILFRIEVPQDVSLGIQGFYGICGYGPAIATYPMNIKGLRIKRAAS